MVSKCLPVQYRLEIKLRTYLWQKEKGWMKYMIRSGEEPVLEEKEKNGITFLSFPALEKTGMVRQLFSTRAGGVSEGIFSSMNLSFTRGDNKEHVLENYRRIAGVLDCDITDFVCSDQTHTTNVRVVGKEDAGKGVVKEKDYTDVDGLITNEPGIVLATFYADCVPLYFVDPVKKAIGLSHSGWRGTVNRMGAKTIELMKKTYGSDPADLLTAIGPSICMSCYEVGSEVAEEFLKAFPKETEQKEILKKKENGKYLLNLWKANYFIMKEAGVKEENISVTDICTCCNGELLFSHRKSQGKRGNLGAFLGLL